MEDHFVPIYDWMRELGLRPGELIAFAVIFSFWKKDGGWYKGSASYLAKWMGVKDKHTATSALSSLLRKELLERRDRYEKGQHLCDYRPCEKITRGMSKNHQGAMSKNHTHYNRPDENRDYNKEINNKEVHLTVDQFIQKHR